MPYRSSWKRANQIGDESISPLGGRQQSATPSPQPANSPRDAGIPQPDTARLAIVVEELVANLYDHGGLSDDDAVEIELSAGPDAISLLLTAPGPPFHPRQSQADDEVPERGGGAGLKLVQAWSLSIDHEHFEGRNRWTVMLPFGSRS